MREKGWRTELLGVNRQHSQQLTGLVTDASIRLHHKWHKCVSVDCADVRIFAALVLCGLTSECECDGGDLTRSAAEVGFVCGSRDGHVDIEFAIMLEEQNVCMEVVMLAVCGRVGH